MYNKIVLDNSVRIISEKIPYLRSVTIGIWVKNGSRFESEEEGGISHFIEHMLFKGTENRSANEIAKQMDLIGGGVNAFTTKECTSYYLKTLDIHLREGISILADMFFNSKFSKEDVDLERSVIKEEIGMYADAPEDVCTEKLFESCFAGSKLGRPILGTNETLDNIDGDKMKDYMKNHYRPGDTLISLSGNFTDDDLQYIKDTFSVMAGSGTNELENAGYFQSFLSIKKDTEQNHLCLGFESLSLSDDRRHTMQILNNILGGGMSSRLFQTVREKNGLCYSIYSFPAAQSEIGLFNIYTALSSSSEEKAILLIKDLIEEFKKNGPTDEELHRCREQVKINILMGLESTGARMSSIAKGELFFGEVLSTDEIVALYDTVTKEHIIELAREIFDFKKASLCAVGKTRDIEFYKNLLV